MNTIYTKLCIIDQMTFISYFEKAMYIHVYTLTFTPQYNQSKPLSSHFLRFVNLYLMTFGIKELENHCKGVMDIHVRHIPFQMKHNK